MMMLICPRYPNRRMAGLHQTVKKWLAEDVYDTRRFEEAYGFQTKTSLKEGLRREVDWYKKTSALPHFQFPLTTF
jgi:nucleoside-diphosphate-sugar epimerase